MIDRKVYFVTSNKGKFEWAKRRLAGFGIELVQKELVIEESRAVDVKDVVQDKAAKAAKVISEPFIIEDSGFYIPALGGFPATQIKFAMKTVGLGNILKMMRGVKDRRAIFRSALIYCASGKTELFECDDTGRLAAKPKGDNYHGFNEILTVFVPDGFSKTLAEMTDREFEEYEKKIEDIDHYHKFIIIHGK